MRPMPFTAVSVANLCIRNIWANAKQLGVATTNDRRSLPVNTPANREHHHYFNRCCHADLAGEAHTIVRGESDEKRIDFHGDN